MCTEFVRIECSKKDTFGDLIEDIMSELTVERKAINLCFVDGHCIYGDEVPSPVFKEDAILEEIFQFEIQNGTVELIFCFKYASDLSTPFHKKRKLSSVKPIKIIIPAFGSRLQACVPVDQNVSKYLLKRKQAFSVS